MAGPNLVRDWETGLNQWGNPPDIWEFAGTGKSSPTIGQRLTVIQKVTGATPAQDINPAQGSYFAKMTVVDGDQYGSSTGYRLLGREGDPIPMYDAGDDNSYTWASLWPAGYPGDRNMYVSGPEMHHTGTTVAPMGFRAMSDGIRLTLFGGNQNSFTRHFDNDANKWPYVRDKWYIWTMRYKHGLAPDGQFELWRGLLGTDATMVRLMQAVNINTMYTGYRNYSEWGLYTDEKSGNDSVTMYFDALQRYAALSDALAYANAILAGGPIIVGPPADTQPTRFLGGKYQTGASLHGSVPNQQRCQKFLMAASGTIDALKERIVPDANVVASASSWPTSISANKRYLLDQVGNPWMMVGDSPQDLFANVSLADAEIYLADRQAKGFNCLWVNMFASAGLHGRADMSTYDGITPFTTAGDMATPRETYFARVDAMLTLAQNHGITVLLIPVETHDHLPMMRTNGATKCFNYGVYLGNRYKSRPNIIWMSGNDYDTWPTDDQYVMGVANGIKSTDPNHLQTVELMQRSPLNSMAALAASAWSSKIQLDTVYTYGPTYELALNEYARANMQMPTFMVEANYEIENNTGGATTTDETIRRQIYWTMLSGATGHLYGHRKLVFFSPLYTVADWKTALVTPAANQVKYSRDLFYSRKWYLLVPDPGHTFCTVGYGTRTTTGDVLDSDYATAAVTPDGTFGMVYLPTIRTVTIALSKMSGPITARWYDPTTGTFSAAISGSPFSPAGTQTFTPAGTHYDGRADWVLVLETPDSAPPTIPGSAVETRQLGLWDVVGGEPSILVATSPAFSIAPSSPPGIYGGSTDRQVFRAIGTEMAIGDISGGIGNLANVPSDSPGSNGFRFEPRDYALGLANWDTAADGVADHQMSIWAEGSTGTPGGGTGQFLGLTVTDDFNRADVGPPPSGSWTAGVYT